MYPNLKSTLLALSFLQNCSGTLQGDFWAAPQSSGVLALLWTCFRFVSWRHPLAWSFVTGCLIGHSQTLQYYLSVHTAKVYQEIYRFIMFLDWANQFSSLWSSPFSTCLPCLHILWNPCSALLYLAGTYWLLMKICLLCYRSV